MKTAPLAALLAAALLAAPPAPGQDAAPAASPPAPQPSPPVRRLLREGTFLDGLHGHLRRDVDSGWWLLRPERRPDDWRERNVPYEIVILPNHRLEDMEQVVRSVAGADPAFEVSGEVFVYGNRNFLLVAHAPRLAEAAPAPFEQVEAEADGVATPGEVASDEEGGETVEDIMQGLVEAVGPLQYSAAPEPGRAEARPVPEGTVLVNRRGQLDRTTDGAWLFVFDADASGLADPPLVVMPCLLLQRIERYARSAGRNAPLILNGRVYQYRGRSYVLPTLFRVPAERTALAP